MIIQLALVGLMICLLRNGPQLAVMQRREFGTHPMRRYNPRLEPRKVPVARMITGQVPSVAASLKKESGWLRMIGQMK